MTTIVKTLTVCAVVTALACHCLDLAYGKPISALRCAPVDPPQANAKRQIPQTAGIIPDGDSTMKKIDGPMIDLLEEVSV